MKKYYVYIHLKKTTGIPFYVGKGCGGRCLNYSEKTRSKYWFRVFSKHGVDCQIHKDNLTEEEAYFEERVLIEKLQHFGIPLCNLAEGGVGPIGVKRSQETREKISKVQIGRKASEKTKEKMKNSQAKIKESKSESAKKQWTEKEKLKARERNVGKILDEETKEKISKTSKSRWEDPEYRRKVSEAQKARWKKLKESKNSS